MRKMSELIRLALPHHKGNGGTQSGLCLCSDEEGSFTYEEDDALCDFCENLMSEIWGSYSCGYLWTALLSNFDISLYDKYELCVMIYEAVSDKLESEGN